MSHLKADRNKRIALDYFAKALSLRTIAKSIRRDRSTVQRIVDRYRKSLTPEQLSRAEAVRKRMLLRYRYGASKPRKSYEKR